MFFRIISRLNVVEVLLQSYADLGEFSPQPMKILDVGYLSFCVIPEVSFIAYLIVQRYSLTSIEKRYFFYLKFIK